MIGFYTFLFPLLLSTTTHKMPCCNDECLSGFMFREKLTHSISCTPPLVKHRHPSHTIKISIRTNINEDERDRLLQEFDDGMDIEDVVNNIEIDNILKYNLKFRYKLKNGTKIFFGIMIKSGTYSPYIGIFMRM